MLSSTGNGLVADYAVASWCSVLITRSGSLIWQRYRYIPLLLQGVFHLAVLFMMTDDLIVLMVVSFFFYCKHTW